MMTKRPGARLLAALLAVALALPPAAPASAQGAAQPAAQGGVSGLTGALGTRAIDAAKLPAGTAVSRIRNSPYVVLRAEPKLESAAVATLTPEDAILVTGRTPGWVKVATTKGSGWMRDYYLQEPAGGAAVLTEQQVTAYFSSPQAADGGASPGPGGDGSGTTATSSTAVSAVTSPPQRIADPTLDPAPPPQRIQDPVPDGGSGVSGGTAGATTPRPVDDGKWLAKFDKAEVMSDAALTDKDSMTVPQIQEFLAARNSVLARPVGSVVPAQAIHDAAQKHGISPKVLLARLQTEQGLVTKKSATQKELDWALGVGCYDSGNWNQNFKGFDKQVDGAAATLRRWYDDGKSKGGNLFMTIDGSQIVTGNAATYSVYKYCPHFSGAELNWKVYKGFFGN